MKSNLLFVLLAITTTQFMNAKLIHFKCLNYEKNNNGQIQLNDDLEHKGSIDADPNQSVLEVAKRACGGNLNLNFMSAAIKFDQAPVTIPGDTKMGDVFLNFTGDESLLEYLHKTNSVLLVRHKRWN